MAAAEAEAEAELSASQRPSTPSCRAKLAPRSPIPVKQKQQQQQNRPLNPRLVAPCGKKTRDLPDLCVCHGCGFRYPDKGGRSSLRALKSQWRVLLLCTNCLGDLRSGAACSYCLSRFSEEEDGRGSTMGCLECRRRVHLTCLPRQRDFVVPTDLDPSTFVCVDCCAVPRFLRPTKVATARNGVGEDSSMEDVVKNANYIVARKEEEASKAKDKALEKALVARSATELARGALDLVGSASKGGAGSEFAPGLADEELALQLHRIMNGSQRILRNNHSLNFGYPVPSKKRISDKLSSIRNANPFEEARTCVEKKPLEVVNVGVTESSTFDSKVQGEIAPDMNSFVHGSLERESDKNKDNPEGGNPGKEEQASCSEKVALSALGDNNVDSISLPSERSSCSYDELGLSDHAAKGGDVEDASAAHLQTACNIRDRYLKKYFRNFRMKRYDEKYCRKSWTGNPGDKKENKASRSMFLSCHSRGSSNASKNTPYARCDFIIIALEASANASADKNVICM